MASSKAPIIQIYLVTAAIAKGKAVKFGTANDTVVVGAANTDSCIGVIQNAPTASGDAAEVATPGGGGKGLLGEAVTRGHDLVSHTDGTLVLPNAEGDQIIARAMASGAAADLIPIEVYFATAHAAQSV